MEGSDRDSRSGGFGGRSFGGRGGGRSFGGRGGGRSFGGRGDFGRRNFGPREMHKAVCAECKKDCEVPFKPSGDRPVYCKECFAKKREEQDAQ